MDLFLNILDILILGYAVTLAVYFIFSCLLPVSGTRRSMNTSYFAAHCCFLSSLLYHAPPGYPLIIKASRSPILHNCFRSWRLTHNGEVIRLEQHILTPSHAFQMYTPVRLTKQARQNQGKVNGKFVPCLVRNNAKNKKFRLCLFYWNPRW
jgi:hypothetical protein